MCYVNNNLSKFGNLRFLAANTFADAWNKAEAGYTYFIDITGNTDSPTTTANRWFGQMWKNDTGKYGWQVAWSFNGTIYKRERNNSDAWTDWNTYALKSDLAGYTLKTLAVSNRLLLSSGSSSKTKFSIDTGLKVNKDKIVPLRFECTNRDGWIPTIWYYLQDNANYLVNFGSDANGQYGGILVYLEKS